MDLFKKYSYNPFEVESNHFLDEMIDYKNYETIYDDINEVISRVNTEIYQSYFKERFNHLQVNFKLISPKRIVFNLFIKTLILQKIKNLHPKKRILLKVYDQELDHIDLGFSGFNANRFSNHYAWISEKVGLPFRIIKIKKKKYIYNHITNTSNFFLKIIDFRFSTILYELKIRLGLNRTKSKIFQLKNNDLVREIKVELFKKNIGVINIDDNLKEVFFNKKYRKLHADSELIEFLNKMIFKNFLKIKSKYKIEQKFLSAYVSILSEISGSYICHIQKVKEELRSTVKILKNKIDFSVCLSSGLFGAYGLSVCDALIHNGIKVFTAEHGLTAGNSKDTIVSENENESKTSHVIFCYNKASKSVFESFKNSQVKAIAVGAPQNAKKIKFKSIQKFIVKKNLNIKKSHVVFYVSHNLQLNSEKYFPYTKSNPMIFEDEKKLLKALGSINKEVFFKLYPTEQYLYEKHDVIKKIERKFDNLNLIDTNDDFRYLRTISDIIITQCSESTLEWCIGVDVPIIFLDSNYYEPLQNEKVRNAFKKSFFVFNYDTFGWEKGLIDFLNLPYSQIISLWQSKAKYREKYDEHFFLSNKKYAGKIGAEYIIDYLKKGYK